MLITVTAIPRDCLFLKNSAPVDVKGKIRDKKPTGGAMTFSCFSLICFLFSASDRAGLGGRGWCWYWAGSVVLFSNLAAPEQEIGFLVPSILMDS